MAIQASGGKGMGCCPVRGVYTGDGTVNRAIAHGLGRIPFIVIVFNTGVSQMNFVEDDLVQGLGAGGFGQAYNVTAADITNFYIGFAPIGFWGNEAGNNFTFIAI